jgi:hypothetical protein
MIDTIGMIEVFMRAARRRWLFPLGMAFLLGFSREASAQPTRSRGAAEAEAQAYLDSWLKDGRRRCESNEHECAAAGQDLARAALAYDAAGLKSKAIIVRKMLIDSRNHLDATEHGERAAFDLATNYRDVTVFDEAAQLYEWAARKYPKSPRAPEALMDAVGLRMALGQADKAEDDVSLFARSYGAHRAPDLANLALALGLFHEETGDLARAKKWLEGWMGPIDRAGNIAARVCAHAALARASSALGDAKAAEKEYAVVRALWKAPDAAVKEIMALDLAPPEKDRRLAQAINAVGEALFFFAEQKRALADAERFPELKGSVSLKRLQSHVKTKVTGWMRKKQGLIEAAEREYLTVVAIEPVPPPRWVIASGLRVGTLWAQLDSDLHGLPIPDEWKGDKLVPGTTLKASELRKAYEEAMGSNDSVKQKARGAFLTCASYSVKFQRFDEFSEACNRWLEKTYPKEFVHVDEIIPKLRGAPGITAPAPVAKSEASE